MNCFYTSMENTMANLILCMNANRLTKGSPCALELFSDTSNVIVDDKVDANGILEIKKLFKKIEEKRNGTEDFTVFTASPAYDLQNSDTDELKGKISCDAYVYVINKEENSCYLRIMRMEAGYKKTEQSAVIDNLVWYTIQTMLPWTYTGRESIGSQIRRDTSLLQKSCVHKSEDYVQIKAVCNTIWDRLAYNIEDLFVDANDALPVKNYFKVEDLQKPTIITSGMPSMFIEREQGTVIMPLESFQLKMDDFFETTPEIIQRNFHTARYVMQKIEGQWKISSLIIEPLVSLPDTPYTKGVRYDLVSKGMADWKLTNTKMPGVYPKDSYEIETVLNAWVIALRKGNLTSFPINYMNHPDFIPEMLIKGRDVNDKLIGLEPITNKTSTMDKLGIDRMISYHTATTPLVEVSENGDFAIGTWFDHSQTNMHSANMYDLHGDATYIPYMVFIARYRHEFKKIDGKWYMSDFFWEPLIDLSEWGFDIANTEGWVRREPYEAYTDPFVIPKFN